MSIKYTWETFPFVNQISGTKHTRGCSPSVSRRPEARIRPAHRAQHLLRQSIKTLGRVQCARAMRACNAATARPARPPTVQRAMDPLRRHRRCGGASRRLVLAAVPSMRWQFWKRAEPSTVGCPDAGARAEGEGTPSGPRGQPSVIGPPDPDIHSQHTLHATHPHPATISPSESTLHWRAAPSGRQQRALW
jgi:hypothetical protein